MERTAGETDIQVATAALTLPSTLRLPLLRRLLESNHRLVSGPGLFFVDGEDKIALGAPRQADGIDEQELAYLLAIVPNLAAGIGNDLRQEFQLH